MRESGLDVEETMRRLYALAALGIVDFADAVPAQAPQPPVAGSEVHPVRGGSPPAEERGRSPSPATAAGTLSAAASSTAVRGGADGEDDDPELRDALVAAYLDHRVKDPFDLLGVPEAAAAPELRKTFLSLADRFSPLRFRSADLKEKAEALLVARARAYGSLADAEQAALWRKRRAAAAERAGAATGRPSTAAQFRISTDLLDASSQYQEGLRRLAAGNARGALEQLQYAADIEPKPLTRAHLAWARYLVDPERHAKLALGELADVARADPACAPAHFFTGEILRAQDAAGEAEEAYRRAHRADPSDRRAQELALEMMRAKKAAK